MGTKEKNVFTKALPEASVIAGTVAGYYFVGIPMWGLGLIALGILAFKTYRQKLN